MRVYASQTDQAAQQLKQQQEYYAKYQQQYQQYYSAYPGIAQHTQATQQQQQTYPGYPSSTTPTAQPNNPMASAYAYQYYGAQAQTHPQYAQQQQQQQQQYYQQYYAQQQQLQQQQQQAAQQQQQQQPQMQQPQVPQASAAQAAATAGYYQQYPYVTQDATAAAAYQYPYGMAGQSQYMQLQQQQQQQQQQNQYQHAYQQSQVKAYSQAAQSAQSSRVISQFGNKPPVPQPASKVSSTDRLLDEIKNTVLNEKLQNKKSRWDSEVVVGEEIKQVYDQLSGANNRNGTNSKGGFLFDCMQLVPEPSRELFTNYIIKSFDKCINAKEQQEISAQLKEKLTSLIFKKEFESTSWADQEMPLLLRESQSGSNTITSANLIATPPSVPTSFGAIAATLVSTFNSTLTTPVTAAATTAANATNASATTGINSTLTTTSSSAQDRSKQQQQQQQKQAYSQQSFANRDSFQIKSDGKPTPNTPTTTTTTTTSSTATPGILPFSINVQPSTNYSNQSYSNPFAAAAAAAAAAQNGKNKNPLRQTPAAAAASTHPAKSEALTIQLTAKEKKALKNQEKQQAAIQRQAQSAGQAEVISNLSISLASAAVDSDNEAGDNEDKWQVVGTCQDLEKPYLRLTKEPAPYQVRPEDVLKKSLKHIMQKWKAGTCEYSYIQSQFRSIRQDLIIQHIKNEFAAKVCETNARICLETDDIPQYVQCCSTLFELYSIGVEGQREEFYCYKIIDSALSNKSPYELEKLLSEVSTFLDHPSIQFAINLVDAHNTGNYFNFFRMISKAPQMSYCIIERKMMKLRLAALTTISKSLQPRIPLEDLKDLLKFDDINHAKEFVSSTGGVLDETGTAVILKESFKGFSENLARL